MRMSDGGSGEVADGCRACVRGIATLKEGSGKL